jgi:hypothetical protein
MNGASNATVANENLKADPGKSFWDSVAAPVAVLFGICITLAVVGSSLEYWCGRAASTTAIRESSACVKDAVRAEIQYLPQHITNADLSRMKHNCEVNYAAIQRAFEDNELRDKQLRAAGG